MHGKQQFCNSFFRTISRAATVALAMAFVLALMVALAPAAQAQNQTFSVIHNFTQGGDGGFPVAGLTLDKAGNLYGTTEYGGSGLGMVFKLTRKGSGWVLSPLYSFQGGSDGAIPATRVIFGPDGSLYGTTPAGGGPGCGGDGCGTVFNLRPPPGACTTALCPWTETVLYRFSGTDGWGPGDLVFDQALYGTTEFGGTSSCAGFGCGIVYMLAPSQGGWTETVLYDFTGGSDGNYPTGGMIFDNAGNLYGTVRGGGSGYGTVYELTPSGAAWQEKTLYSFVDSGFPVGGLIFDGSGNLYGTTDGYMSQCAGGYVYELTRSNGNWTVAHALCLVGSGGWPSAGLVMDAGGNLYGTSTSGSGIVFEVFPDWTSRILHAFTGNDGFNPLDSLILDANGNIYGTAIAGGAYGDGVVFEITP